MSKFQLKLIACIPQISLLFPSLLKSMVVLLISGSKFCNWEEVFFYLKNQLFLLGRIGLSTLDAGLFDFQFRKHETLQLVHFLTENYRQQIAVDCSELDLSELNKFKDKRPYFFTIFIDEPPVKRYKRYCDSFYSSKLENAFLSNSEPKQEILILEEEKGIHKMDSSIQSSFETQFEIEQKKSSDNSLLSIESFLALEEDRFFDIRQLKNICWIVMGRQPIDDILGKINFNEEVRPCWDRYFMLLARHTANRSNCMKKKVGCIVVKNQRVIAAGYNGTPYSMKNCNEGGCPRCNNPDIKGGQRLEECFCIHAEENALLECGKTAQGGTLYCSTCPCIGCAKKIVQIGIERVFYSDSFHMDEISHRIFHEANIQMICFKYE